MHLFVPFYLFSCFETSLSRNGYFSFNIDIMNLNFTEMESQISSSRD